MRDNKITISKSEGLFLDSEEVEQTQLTIINNDLKLTDLVNKYPPTKDYSIIYFFSVKLGLLAIAKLKNEEFNNKQTYDYITNQMVKIGATAVSISIDKSNSNLYDSLVVNTRSFFLTTILYDVNNKNVIDIISNASAQPFDEKRFNKVYNEELSNYLDKYVPLRVD